MNKTLPTIAVSILILVTLGSEALAQTAAQPEKVPVKLQVVVSTYDGDRKVSSMPYTMLATANGSEVIFTSSSNIPIQNGASGATTYTNLGTTLRCTVTTEAGSFKVSVNFDDKSIMASRASAAVTGATRAPDSVTFHSVNYNSAISMKDGETKELISAPDKVTGEIVKIDVTLTLETPRRAAAGAGPDLFAKAEGLTTIAIPFSLN